MEFTMTPEGPTAFTVEADDLNVGRVFHVHEEGWGWKINWSDDGTTVFTTKQVLTQFNKGGKTDGSGLKTSEQAFAALKKAAGRFA
jgi:hypothetical protein